MKQPKQAVPPRGFSYVAEALRLEDFPMGRHEIDYCVGDVDVEDGRGGYISVRDLTDDLGDQQFRSAEEVIRTLRDLRQTKRRRAA